MDLSNIELVLQIDTGTTGDPAYDIITETYTNTISAGDSVIYSFLKPYTVPWNAIYYVVVTANLPCNIVLANNKDQITECVDMKDLYIASIDNPSSGTDVRGSDIQVTVTLRNRSDRDDFTNVRITVLVENSQGEQTETFTETVDKVDYLLGTKTYTFTRPYTVPDDAVYYLRIYTDSYDNYRHNDTSSIQRGTSVGISSIGKTNVFTLGQNIPNPATNSTRINYSVPEAGEVIFHVHSITGQLLYSKTIDTKRGTNSIELNTSLFAAGVYFYSMEYKGQRLIRQLIISN
jgi:hypothetical protein